MTRSRQTADWGSRAGLAKVIPSSVAVSTGTASADATGKVTFTTANTVSLNNVFSATYDNYRVIVSNLVGNSGTSLSLTLRLRVNNTDTTTNYYWQRIRGSGTSVTASSANITSEINLGVYNSGNRSHMVFDITSPFLSVNTLLTNQGFDFDNNAQTQVSTGGVNDGTNYTGLTIIGSSTNMSGQISVYGYN